MSGLYAAISIFWLLPVICHALDIPSAPALLVRGRPVGLGSSTLRHKRSEMLNGNVVCKEDEYRPRNRNFCCNKCLAGYKVAQDCPREGLKTECATCEDGQYTKYPHGDHSCEDCTECLTQFGQVEVQPCTTINDTVCGCPKGYYKSNSDRKFTCLECSKCPNGSIQSSCTSDRNTICHCYGNYYPDPTGQCRSCDECNLTEDCAKHCPTGLKKPEELDMVMPLVAGVMALIILALVATIIFKNRKRLVSAFKKKSPLPVTVESGSSQLSNPLMESYSSPDKPEYLPGHKVYVVDGGPQIQNEAQSTPLPLPDITLQTKTPSLKSTEVLYKIIDCIPVPRWKEMIRLLGVSDNNIERCMQENRHYKEAQYEMLSYWVHGAGSSQVARETLFNVLREMHLGGCVEKIQEFL